MVTYWCHICSSELPGIDTVLTDHCAQHLSAVLERCGVSEAFLSSGQLQWVRPPDSILNAIEFVSAFSPTPEEVDRVKGLFAHRAEQLKDSQIENECVLAFLARTYDFPEFSGTNAWKNLLVQIRDVIYHGEMGAGRGKSMVNVSRLAEFEINGKLQLDKLRALYNIVTRSPPRPVAANLTNGESSNVSGSTEGVDSGVVGDGLPEPGAALANSAAGAITAAVSPRHTQGEVDPAHVYLCELCGETIDLRRYRSNGQVYRDGSKIERHILKKHRTVERTCLGISVSTGLKCQKLSVFGTAYCAMHRSQAGAIPADQGSTEPQQLSPPRSSAKAGRKRGKPSVDRFEKLAGAKTLDAALRESLMTEGDTRPSPFARGGHLEEADTPPQSDDEEDGEANTDVSIFLMLAYEMFQQSDAPEISDHIDMVISAFTEGILRPSDAIAQLRDLFQEEPLLGRQFELLLQPEQKSRPQKRWNSKNPAIHERTLKRPRTVGTGLGAKYSGDNRRLGSRRWLEPLMEDSQFRFITIHDNGPELFSQFSCDCRPGFSPTFQKSSNIKSHAKACPLVKGSDPVKK